MRALVFAVAALLVVGVPAAPAGAVDCSDGGSALATTVALPDHRVSGNRVVASCEGLGSASRTFEAPAPVAWVVPDPAAPGRRWVVAADDGTIWRLREGGQRRLRTLRPGVAPVVFPQDDGSVIVRSRREGRRRFREPLPDGRVVRPHGFGGVALVGPTERYPHGVLGDGIEASAFEITSDVPGALRVDMGDDEVIEGITPLLADVAGDQQKEILVTVSDADDGARLRLYDAGGDPVAESAPIGTGFRWLHQIGAGATGPDGATEIIAVRTPHIGGVVEAYRVVGDRLERVAAIEGYSSHQLGSRNLDMALLADADADGRLDIIVPTQAMDALAVLTRVEDSWTEIRRLPLDGRLVSNVAAAVDEGGRLYLAAATDDGRLHVFG